jgi:hypothetical protein
MTTSELIQLLRTLPGDLPVLLFNYDEGLLAPAATVTVTDQGVELSDERGVYGTGVLGTLTAMLTAEERAEVLREVAAEREKLRTVHSLNE